MTLKIPALYHSRGLFLMLDGHCRLAAILSHIIFTLGPREGHHARAFNAPA